MLHPYPTWHEVSKVAARATWCNSNALEPPHRLGPGRARQYRLARPLVTVGACQWQRPSGSGAVSGLFLPWATRFPGTLVIPPGGTTLFRRIYAVLCTIAVLRPASPCAEASEGRSGRKEPRRRWRAARLYQEDPSHRMWRHSDVSTMPRAFNATSPRRGRVSPPQMRPSMSGSNSFAQSPSNECFANCRGSHVMRIWSSIAWFARLAIPTVRS